MVRELKKKSRAPSRKSARSAKMVADKDLSTFIPISTSATPQTTNVVPQE
jgi:hypothetical protein